MIKLKTPLSEEAVRKLKIGDMVELSGVVFTARDMAHKYFIENPDRFRDMLKNSVIFHCGPIAKKEGSEWKIAAAGPTTSIREEPYEADVIKNYGIRAVIGKGGMGEKTLAAMKKYGCAYLSAVGGIAALIAKSIKKVKNVYMLDEFGVPEAIWELEVEGFPAIVTMDANGNSLHNDILKKSEDKYKKLIR